MRAERDNHPVQAYITRKNANFHSSGGGNTEKGHSLLAADRYIYDNNPQLNIF